MDGTACRAGATGKPARERSTAFAVYTGPQMAGEDPMHRLDDRVRFDERGLVPVVVQDATSKEVLMVAYMSEATLIKTLESGLMTYWSRSRSQEWVKGETSGNYQEVVSARLDCDRDTLLFHVRQIGDGACHTGRRSCFFRPLKTAAKASTGV